MKKTLETFLNFFDFFPKEIGQKKDLAHHFTPVSTSSQSLLLALLRQHFSKISPSPKCIWVLCPDLRSQEQITNELYTWKINPLFFPAQTPLKNTKTKIIDPEAEAERLSVLEKITHQHNSQQKNPAPSLIILQKNSLQEHVPSPEKFIQNKKSLFRGQSLPLESFCKTLQHEKYERVPQIYARGQYARRGGIVDLFSWQHSSPIRIEWFGDEIDSLREFDIDSQISYKQHEEIQFISQNITQSQEVELRDYCNPNDPIITIDCEEKNAALKISSHLPKNTAPNTQYIDTFTSEPSPLGTFQAGDLIREQSRQEYLREQLQAWQREKWHLAIAFNNEGEQQRFQEIIQEKSPPFTFLQGELHRSFILPKLKVAVLSGSEIFGRYQNTRAHRRFANDLHTRRQSKPLDISNLAKGDLVVHTQHGIGSYEGIQKRRSPNGKYEENLVLKYADDAKLYVPIELSHLVSRYVGVGKHGPKLNKLGGARWNKARETAEKEILDYAAKLLQTQANRATHSGFAHSPDTHWQEEFENSFLYQETPDQLRSIHDSKKDMEQAQPMDRLICGDVGFGKTEIAIRAAFKAVMSETQVAVLAPTTVLSQQHFHTFKERYSDYPIRVELLNRYRTHGEARAILQDLKNGAIDVLIGTHRLLSNDVHFKKLGLAVIDEEQRFGVAHKERFKELFATIDVLTLSATPIPRTLYLSLMGVREMSTIDTPPLNRFPIDTHISPYSEPLIRDAINRELQRNGQVYFLHNRVKSIEKMQEKILRLCPKARVAIGHGQMHEHELEDVMKDFVAGNIDVLLCTTIIENGLDIPNANTIIIDRADRLGLAQLYQLRGRVGRAQHRAYALLLLPRDRMTTGDATKRVHAIRQYHEIGSGFKIAMRDLEIRGAGNLLGTRQSGHIAAIGFDLYCQLLKQSIAKLKGQTSPTRIDTILHIPFLARNDSEYAASTVDGEEKIPCFLPYEYIEDTTLRIRAYRQLAECMSMKDLRKLQKEWTDRFGAPPKAVETLLIVTELRIRAAHKHITTIEIDEDKLLLSRNAAYIQLNGKFPRLKQKTNTKKLNEALQMLTQL